MRSDFSITDKPRYTEDGEPHYAQPNKQCTDKTTGLSSSSYKTALDAGRTRLTHTSHRHLSPLFFSISACITDLVADPFDLLPASRLYNNTAERLSSILHVSQLHGMGKHGRDLTVSQSRGYFTAVVTF